MPAPQNSTVEMLITHTSTESTIGLILFPSLADQDEGLLVQIIYVYVQWGFLQQLDLGS